MLPHSLRARDSDARHAGKFGIFRRSRLPKVPRASYSPEFKRVALVFSVFIDLCAAASVVSLLPTRLRALGVSHRVNGLMSSMFSLAQIIGGLALGALSDRQLGRRGLMLMSFVGASFSYALVGLPNASLPLLFLSRIIVGLTKHSTTASTALMTELTAVGAERTYWIGKLASAVQMAWIVGQALGGVLNRIGTAAPAAFAVSMYVIDIFLVHRTFPQEQPRNSSQSSRNGSTAEPASQCSSVFRAFVSPNLFGLVVITLAHQFVFRAILTVRVLYEMDRWLLNTEDISWLMAYKSFVLVISSWQLVGVLSRHFRTGFLLYISAIASVIAYSVETFPGHALLALLGDNSILSFLPSKVARDPSLLVFAFFCFPVHAAAGQVTSVALKSRFTEVVPKSEIAGALASLDVLQSITGVIAPLVGGLLFSGITPVMVPLRCAVLEGIVLALVWCLIPLENPSNTPLMMSVAPVN